MSLSVNKVSFEGRKTTKQGNEYNKTNAGKYTGLALATLSSVGMVNKVVANHKNLKNQELVKISSEYLEKLAKLDETKLFGKVKRQAVKTKKMTGINIKQAAQSNIIARKVGVSAVAIAVVAAIFTGVGAIFDKISNKRSANAVDKATN